uniref:Protein FAR1-RELATED SEQUENCE n=1 Tax=Aegilops tauschii TaxID=37682 RepID=M8BK46_AEGTA
MRHFIYGKCWLLKSKQFICGGCFYRLRIGAAAPSRTPCPNYVSAFEKARSYANNPAENVITPVIGTTFDSLGEAYYFYNLYSWEKGFVIRYGKSRLNLKRTPGSISRTTGGANSWN